MRFNPTRLLRSTNLSWPKCIDSDRVVSCQVNPSGIWLQTENVSRLRRAVNVRRLLRAEQFPAVLDRLEKGGGRPPTRSANSAVVAAHEMDRGDRGLGTARSRRRTGRLPRPHVALRRVVWIVVVELASGAARGYPGAALTASIG